MNSEKLLLEHVSRYRMLSGELGPDARPVTDEYRRLKDLLIVEVYFMKPVRRIVSDDEMSGFVLYVEKDLRTMVDSYDFGRSPLLAFLTHNMELRAMSYLARTRRSRCFCSRFTNRLLAVGEDMVQPGPEEILLQQEESKDDGDAGSIVDCIRYMCSVRPTKQRNLFIFLCTLLPCSSTDMVENFCVMLNIDSAQTFAISDYLTEIDDETCSSRPRREYLRMRRNYFLMRRIELEAHIRSALDERKLARKLEYQRRRLRAVHQELERAKMNVKYRIISEVLGIGCAEIASAVYYAKKILKGASVRNAGYIHHANGKPQLRRFEPFEEFNITMIPRPVTCGLMIANKLSSKYGENNENTACKLERAQAS